MPALVISKRNKSDSCSNEDSKDNNNNDDNEWNLLKSNSRRQSTTHHKSTRARQPTGISRDFGDSDSNEYSDNTESEDIIPRLMERYNKDGKTREEPNKFPSQAPRKPTDKKAGRWPIMKVWNQDLNQLEYLVWCQVLNQLRNQAKHKIQTQTKSMIRNLVWSLG